MQETTRDGVTPRVDDPLDVIPEVISRMTLDEIALIIGRDNTTTKRGERWPCEVTTAIVAALRDHPDVIADRGLTSSAGSDLIALYWRSGVDVG